ncbi:glycosyltransferase [Streptomyces varsoviensis]|uniref:glycosyltransferase n=1 Tax=Streptomyces varsoviensis TaxID=67373 RepID=UPI0004C738D8|nr:glycosyltransferase [Streptomyces varsoviensis]
MRPRAIAVVVPAHDEEALLPRALAALGAARRHASLAGVRVLTVVAADRCRDATAALARRAGAHVLPVDYRNVGLARAAAVAYALDVLGGPAGVWVASTDADSAVPADWLAFYTARGREGWEAVVGTVTVDAWPPAARGAADRHQRQYYATRPPYGPWHHPHVHGANLGVSAEAYVRAEGFPPLPLGEDHALVAALDRRGHRVLRTSDCPVATSGRLRPRAHGGFGDAIAALAPRP